MNKTGILIFILALAGFSCQQSGEAGAERLRQKVIASSEFAALAEARQSKGSDLIREMEEERRRFNQELEQLSPEEQQKRREERASAREAEREKQQEIRELMEERNRQIRALMKGEDKLSREAFEEAVRKIDESLGITAEMAAPSGTARLEAAMKALMDKFPAISEQGPGFIQSCFEAYEAEREEQGKGK